MCLCVDIMLFTQLSASESVVCMFRTVMSSWLIVPLIRLMYHYVSLQINFGMQFVLSDI